MADPSAPRGAQNRSSVANFSLLRLPRSAVPPAGGPGTATPPPQSTPTGPATPPLVSVSTMSPTGAYETSDAFPASSRPSLPRSGGRGRHFSARQRALARASIAGATTPLNNVFAVQLDGDDGGVEMHAAQASLLQAVCLRASYKSKDKGQQEAVAEGSAAMAPPRTLHLDDGIFSFAEQRTVAVPWEDFYDDVTSLLECVNQPQAQRACRRRLHVLEQKYKLYDLCNCETEKGTDRFRKGAGLFADACRVDNGLLFSHAMSAPQLVEFMTTKMVHHGDDVVATSRDHETAGEGPETLAGVCNLLDLNDPHALTPEALGLQPLSEKPIASYDPLDPTANPGGASCVELLRLFLTRHTLNGGDYLAEAVKTSTLDPNDARQRTPQATETILDVSGMLPGEWEQLAAWVKVHHLNDYRTNCFQVRLSAPSWRRRGGGGGSTMPAGGGDTTAGAGAVNAQNDFDEDGSLAGPARASRFNPPEEPLVFDNHQQHLDNLFLPLFHATLAPEDPKNADLADLLQHVGAIDLVMDSTGGGGRSSRRRRRRPADVPWSESVDDLYFAYYVWANLCSLNAFRRRRGMNVLQLRAVAGTLRQSSAPNLGLVIAYLLCDHVMDGLALVDAPVLQYLYALHRIGVSVAPTASSSLGATTYTKHPFLTYMRSGLRVALSTRSPLLFHVSSQPLTEEYNTARRLFLLSGADLCEVALNSVTMSAFDTDVVSAWIGEAFAAELARLPFLASHHENYLAAVPTPAPALTTTTTVPEDKRMSGSASQPVGTATATTGAAASVPPRATAAPRTVEELAAFFANHDILSEAWRHNTAELTAVPTSRLEFRWETWVAELDVLLRAGAAHTAAESAEAERKDSQLDASGEQAASAPEQPDGGSGRRGSRVVAGSVADKGRQAPSRRPSTSLRHAVTGGLEEAPSSLIQLLHHGAGAARSRAPYVVVDPALDFPRVVLTGPYDRDTQYATAAQALARAVNLRNDYMRHLRCPDDCGGDVRSLFALIQNPLYQTEEAFKNSASKKEKGLPSSSSPDGFIFDEDEWMYKTVEGVVVPHEVHQIPRLPRDMYHFDDFKQHVEAVRALMENPLIRQFAVSRLRMLERRFSLHVAVNNSREAGSTAAKASQNRDFYQSAKVDNTVRMECGMTARQLLDFILSKARNNGDDIVSHQRGKEPQTLRQLLQELNISAENLTVDELNVQGDPALGSETSALYKPDGRDELLTLVLKTDNRMNGRYFAELTKHVFDNMKRDRFTFSENRLPIYGKSPEEWSLLSSWFDTHGMSSSHNQWVIQLPRIYGYLRKKGCVQNFAEYLENIFKPLWSTSLHPSKDPRLFHCVNHIAGFDCVEDEHRPDTPLHAITLAPHEWTSEEDPPYNYYLYHLWANVSSLNEFRRRRRFSTFTLRPSCGESGSLDHLIGGFLLANSISYGVQLKEDDVLQYLYYLTQIGVTMCPLSNNSNVVSYLDHPFPRLFHRGLKVSLGTDCPLLYHHTQEPLIEEYSIASKIWKLSPNDMCEIARNSVLLSGFSPVFKQAHLGDTYFLSSSRSNDASRTHLADVRVAYRYEVLHSELGFLEYISGHNFPKPSLTLSEEAALAQEYAHRVRQLKEQPLQGVLIDANPDNTDLEALQRTRTHMQRQLEELHTTLSGLQKQNKQLTEKLAEEREREQQVTVMRRRQIALRTNDELQGYERLLLQQHMAGMGAAERSAFEERLQKEDVGALLAEVNSANRMMSGVFALTAGGGRHTSETAVGLQPSEVGMLAPEEADEDPAVVAANRTEKAWRLQDSPSDWGLAMDDFYDIARQSAGGGRARTSIEDPADTSLPRLTPPEEHVASSRSGPLPPTTAAGGAGSTPPVKLNRAALLGFSETLWRKDGGPSAGVAGVPKAAEVAPASSLNGTPSLPPVRSNGRTSSATFIAPAGRDGGGGGGVARTVPPRF